jgi:hypothetical protein
MAHVIQLSLLSQKPVDPPKGCHVRYIAPSVEDIDQYAHQVCRAFAQRSGGQPDTDMERGFAAFMRAVAAIIAHRLNREAPRPRTIKRPNENKT